MLNLSVNYKSINTSYIVSHKLNLLNNTTILERFWNYLTLHYTNLLTNLLSFGEDIFSNMSIYFSYTVIAVVNMIIELIISLIVFLLGYRLF